MRTNELEEKWLVYREQERARATRILADLGYALDAKQVHAGGERHLMAGARDVGGGGYKLVLLGTALATGQRVVIKVSSTVEGKKEIERERTSREVLHTLNFATRNFFSPKELRYTTIEGLLIFITEYIEQEQPLMERELQEQFFLSLRIFETQEGAHATTSAHTATIKNVFGMTSAHDYLTAFEQFITSATEAVPTNTRLIETLKRAKTFLTEHRTDIERYGGFLTHADFVPNNLRVRGNDVYLLDYASIHFGNKYESWARYINFMVHHNPALEKSLLEYVRANRGEKEYLALRLMRAYKLGFLLSFYALNVASTSGNLRELTELRIAFWTRALEAVLKDERLESDTILDFLTKQKGLRSAEELERQKELIGINKTGVR